MRGQPSFIRRHRRRPRYPGIPPGSTRLQARTRGPPRRRRPPAHSHRPWQPDTFSTVIWTAFATRGADQRIKRFLAIPKHPDLNHAAKHLGIRAAVYGVFVVGEGTSNADLVGACLERDRRRRPSALPGPGGVSAFPFQSLRSSDDDSSVQVALDRASTVFAASRTSGNSPIPGHCGFRDGRLPICRSWQASR